MSTIDNDFKPYLLGTFYSWAVTKGYHPYVEILNSIKNNIPNSKIGETVVLNIHPDAVRDAQFTSTHISFKAAFDGTTKDVTIYYDTISSIFTSEGNCEIEFDNLISDRPNLYRIK